LSRFAATTVRLLSSPAALLLACAAFALPWIPAIAIAAAVLAARIAVRRRDGKAYAGIGTAVFAFAGAVLLRQAIGVPLRPVDAYVSIVQIVFIVGVPAVFALGCFAAAATRGEVRQTIAVSVVSIALGLWATELALALSREDVPKRWGTYQIARAAADQRHERFDGRGDIEVVDDLRRAGADAWTMFSPSNFLYGNDPVLSDRGDGPLTLSDGRRILPLAAIANAESVYCNEGGRYLVFKSDEAGFNNPRGLWSKDSADIVLLGDSFAQGACVTPDEGMGERLRARTGTLVNLGMGGTGPLYQLATLKEFGARFAPKHVVWLFYEGNDLHTNLIAEMEFASLRRYIDGGPTGQLAHGGEIDTFLRATARKLMDAARDRRDAWPTPRLPRLADVLRLRTLMAGIGFSVCPSIDQLRLDDYARVVRAGRDAVAAWGGKLTVVYLPAWDRSCGALDVVEGRWHWPHRAVRQVLDVAGVDVLDLHDRFRADPDPARLFWYPGSHYSAVGHAFVADAIATHLGLAAANPPTGARQ